MRPCLIDLHEDIAFYYTSGGLGLRFGVEDFGLDLEKRHADIPKFRRGNVRLVFAPLAPLSYTVQPERSRYLAKMYRTRMHPTVLTANSAKGVVLEQMKIYYNLLKTHTGDLSLVETRRDLTGLFDACGGAGDGKREKKSRGDAALSRGRETRKRRTTTGLLVSIEGAEPLEDVEDLDIFWKLGVRSLHLTWNFDNRYSASCMSKKDYGLTGEGEALVERANALGVVLDLAHASREATLQTLAMTKLPVIFSHANSRAVRDHVRNVDDEELEILREVRGVIGFTTIATTIAKKADVGGLADHIMHVYDRFGPDLLAIGTDFFGTSDLPEPEGLEDVTRFPNLWSELSRRGMKPDDIAKISYRNALRVIEENTARW